VNIVERRDGLNTNTMKFRVLVLTVPIFYTFSGCMLLAHFYNETSDTLSAREAQEIYAAACLEGVQTWNSREVCPESGSLGWEACYGDCVPYCPQKVDADLVGAVNKRVTAQDENCTLGTDRDCHTPYCVNGQMNVYCGLYCDYTQGCV
jgi:hypothetical protein